MGTLKYDGTTAQFDDRVLAHVQTVVVEKMRRQESFQLSWSDSEELGGGRTGIWIHPATTVTFHFLTNDDPHLSRAWLDLLTASANSPRGMFVTDEDGRPAHPTDVLFD